MNKEQTKKILEINCAACDTTEACEQTLSAYQAVKIHAAVVWQTRESAQAMARCNVSIDAANVVTVPQGARMVQKNGRFSIGAGQKPAVPTALIVNGRLNIEKGAADALAGYVSVQVNGSVCYPESLSAQAEGFTVNGSSESYPDDAVVLARTFTADRVFALRAKKGTYYCARRVILTDPAAEAAVLCEKGVRFLTRRAIIAESMLAAALPMFSEQTEVTAVPDGCAYLAEDSELNRALLHRYGTRLYIDGSLTVPNDAAAELARLEYLHVGGSVHVPAALVEAFCGKTSAYEKLDVVRPTLLCGRPEVTIDRSRLEREGGVSVRDCAEVTIRPDLPAGLLESALDIADCAEVRCSVLQRAAVEQICTDVASVETEETDGAAQDDPAAGERQVINAAAYKL
jgi:hypothetical protein